MSFTPGGGGSGPFCTCHFAVVRNPDGAEAVVGDGCDLASAPRSVMVVVVRVRVRHGVWVIGVQVVTTLRTLNNGKTVVGLYRNSMQWGHRTTTAKTTRNSDNTFTGLHAEFRQIYT